MTVAELVDQRKPFSVDGLPIPGPLRLHSVSLGIGDAAWHEDAGEWRCLADVDGALCLIAFKIRTAPRQEKAL